MAKKRLQDLTLKFLSGVGNPANAESNVVLLKSRDGKPAPTEISVTVNVDPAAGADGISKAVLAAVDAQLRKRAGLSKDDPTAADLTANAGVVSAKAHKSGSSADHLEAVKAHTRAAKAHDIEGNYSMSEAHTQMASAHGAHATAQARRNKSNDPAFIEAFLPAVLKAYTDIATPTRLLAKARGAVPSAFSKAVKQLLKDAQSFDEVLEGREWDPMINALCQSLWSITSDGALDDAGKTAAIKESLAEFITAIDDGEEDDDTDGITKSTTDEDDMTPEQINELVSKAVATAVPAALAPIQTQLTKALDDNTKLAEKNTLLEGNLESLRKEARTRTLMAKAQAVIDECKAPVKAEDVAKALDGMTDEQQESHLALVKQMGALAGEANLGKIWSGAAEVSKEVEVVENKVNTMAKALMAADPKLTVEQAITKVYTTHPDLYEEMEDAAFTSASS